MAVSCVSLWQLDALISEDTIQGAGHVDPLHEALPASTKRAYLPRNMGGLWVVRGVSYNLTEFIEKHPGGKRYLLNTRDSDVTALFESMHIGTTASSVLPRYRVDSVPPLVSSPRGEANARYFALRRAIKAQHDLNDLKTPSAEYVVLQVATVGMYGGALYVCLTTSSARRAWAAHVVLGLSIAWLGGFAHNGLHMWSRRKWEALSMYLSLSNNPFRWMYVHVTSHHMHTNTLVDHDKRAVADMQRWWHSNPALFWIVGLFGVFLSGMQNALLLSPGTAQTAPSMTACEQAVPPLLFLLVVLVGLRCQGWRWLPRMAVTIGVSSLYAFIFFQASHLHAHTLDGDQIRAQADDWGEFQLRTSKGWGQLGSPLTCLPWLFLNLQPAHHLFPAVHHSKLALITPLIREYYPGLMDDASLPELLGGMLHTLTQPPRPPRRVVREKRCNCGWRGVTVQECEALAGGRSDCIFDDTLPNAPFCFIGANSSRARSCVSDAIR